MDVNKRALWRAFSTLSPSSPSFPQVWALQTLRSGHNTLEGRSFCMHPTELTSVGLEVGPAGGEPNNPGRGAAMKTARRNNYIASDNLAFLGAHSRLLSQSCPPWSAPSPPYRSVPERWSQRLSLSPNSCHVLSQVHTAISTTTAHFIPVVTFWILPCILGPEHQR